MAAAKKSRGSTGSRKRSADYGLKKVSLIPDISAEAAPAASLEKKSEKRSSAERPDPISTSPLAMQAYELIKILDPLIGVAEASFFMNRSNELLGVTPVTAIKEGRLADVTRAVHAVAMEKGVFDAPWSPPK